MLAQAACERRAIRVNGSRTVKPHFLIGAGDVLTFAQGQTVRVVRVKALAERRGAAPDARTLYDDLSADPSPTEPRREPE